MPEKKAPCFGKKLVPRRSNRSLALSFVVPLFNNECALCYLASTIGMISPTFEHVCTDTSISSIC